MVNGGNRVLSSQPRTFALAVGTSPVKLCDKDPKRRAMLVYNNGSVTIYILSAQNLAAAQGIPVVANAAYQNDDCYGEYWIVAASGSQDVRVELDSE